jgi:hypothetical protein
VCSRVACSNLAFVDCDVAPEADELNQLCPETNRRADERSFVGIDERSIPDKVDFSGRFHFVRLTSFQKTKRIGATPTIV